MIRRSHILTTAALLAVCATPAQAGSDYPVGPPPSAHAEGPYVLNRDYGSPDAIDAAGRSPVQVPVMEARQAPPGGFDWGDAVIGAAGMLGLFSIAAACALLLTGWRRRHGLA